MPEITTEVLDTFQEEADERLESIESKLLKLERMRSPDQDTVNAMFRDAHSLKSSANLLGFTRVERTAHIMEHLMDAMRKNALAPDPEVVSVLLEGVDAIRLVLNATRTGEGADVSETEAAMARLAGQARGGRP